MTPADVVLSRLEGVRATGAGRWTARCPAHDDKHPSLSLRELEDGRLLLHCWAGCGVDDVVDALGLALHDLFPTRTQAGGGAPRERRPWTALDLVKLAALEAEIVFVVACDMRAGREIDDDDFHRLIEATKRLGAMRDACHDPR